MTDARAGGIDWIIDVARGAAAARPGDREHRGATRHPYDGRAAIVQIHPSGARTEPVMLDCRDIGVGGMGAVAPRSLFAGARGGVLIERSDGRAVILSVRVVYSTPRRAGGFECGIHFERTLPAVSLNDFRDRSGHLPDVGCAEAA